ncbi:MULTISPECIES: flagellar hook protein FlgE [unclassified Marinobacter]|jgi:flagellar hook protein FlgE|uniref:flagellar hook protein FlgE n=1 Tax=unclassified Marinobacter TaxID=83889 RepID=UPI00200EC786|nr:MULTISPECIES: flagellar hook protein FlgE [unclassified Marinobacter]MCL1478701.1 flagellar hook protein FlgE [Marinobacter sp.]MCL1484288.1 flagellar hook protein FlgE [Marinobacter sp.]UQG57817.1 flagellar hook protein FlgE [Marinobacter sp. M4C]UQG66622.1 flagellar hook protein FlgE [Marinobacter sp. M2C]UQG70902.1 flagellar hook protein FlgE [Marinobacter sp. M1C]
MAFNTGLSGLRAAAVDLDVTGNNIANASTVGFKSSRVQFGDLYANGFLSSGNAPVGDGVRVQGVKQSFGQGNVSFTDNGLDLAIDGDGFFELNNGGEKRYSRAGQFGTDKDGFVVNNQNMRLQGYIADAAGNLSGRTGDLQIGSDNLAPQRTTDLRTDLNLDAREQVLTATPFDPLNPGTYNHVTATTIFDSLGNPHELTQFYAKKDPSSPSPGVDQSNWSLFLQIDGEDVGDTTTTGATSNPAASLVFDQSGSLTSPANGVIPINNWVPKDGSGASNGAATMANAKFDLDLGNTTQYGANFGVNDQRQNGYTTGRLSGLDVSQQGVIFARYTNGQSKSLGQVALASFNNTDGLSPSGDTSWVETFESGQPIIGRPDTGTLGAIQASSVEESNVDLSAELVNLIIAQRNYQANAKTIETSDAVTQTIINLR